MLDKCIKSLFIIPLYSSGTSTESVVVTDSHVLTHVSEVVVINVLRVDVVHSDVHVQTRLNVVSGDICLFEIICCLTHAICYALVSGRNPTSLHLG